MPSLQPLHTAVQGSLKKVGTPVFVRYLLFSQDKKSEPSTALASLLQIANNWIGQPLDRLFAVGSAATGNVTLTCEFRGGATALLSWSTSPARGIGADIFVLGSNGAIYHDGGHDNLWDQPPELPATATKFGDLVRQALQSNQPVAAGGQP